MRQADLRKELLAQLSEQRSWFSRAMTVWSVVNMLATAAVAVALYMALEPSLTPRPDTLGLLCPAITGVILGLFGLVLAQLIRSVTGKPLPAPVELRP